MSTRQRGDSRGIHRHNCGVAHIAQRRSPAYATKFKDLPDVDEQKSQANLYLSNLRWGCITSYDEYVRSAKEFSDRVRPNVEAPTQAAQNSLTARKRVADHRIEARGGGATRSNPKTGTAAPCTSSPALTPAEQPVRAWAKP